MQNMAPPLAPPSSSRSPLKMILIGCGSIAGLGILGAVSFFIWAARQPEGGVKLAGIREVRPVQSPLGGVALEIESDSGDLMKIEIAPLNNGETFKSALLRRWEQAKAAPATAP